MRIRGLGQLRRSLRFITASFRSVVAILFFHRVSEAVTDPQLLCVHPRRFVEHLEYLSRHFRIISLGELALALQCGRFPHRAVVITFDDGYADNLHNLKPLLEQHEVPATVFVTTGNMRNGHEFWWDRIESLILGVDPVPQSLRLPIQGRDYCWSTATLEERRKAFADVQRLLVQCSPEQIETGLSDLASWRGIDEAVRPLHRPLQITEVQQLAEGGLVEIGAHTVSHVNLLAQSPERQWSEINQSKADLEEVLGKPVTSFSYPFGYTDDTICQMVQDAGFKVACAIGDGVVERGADPFRLGRLLVRDWDGDVFARKLGEYLTQ